MRLYIGLVQCNLIVSTRSVMQRLTLPSRRLFAENGQKSGTNCSCCMRGFRQRSTFRLPYQVLPLMGVLRRHLSNSISKTGQNRKVPTFCSLSGEFYNVRCPFAVTEGLDFVKRNGI